MQKVFDIPLEFNRNVFNKTVVDAIKEKKKGYICIVDGNVLAHTSKYPYYKEIINNALINSCDGSSIAQIAGLIYKRKFKTYTGPEIFSFFVNQGYKQVFLGNSAEVQGRLQKKFMNEGLRAELMKFISLPFKNVEDFSYEEIAEEINNYSPSIIWISLGAPKQEIFANNLLPHISEGILFSIGAAFNFYLEDEEFKRAPSLIRNAHLEWLYRSIQEPKRVGTRALGYVQVLPKLIYKEFKNRK